eukprot:scaffold1507_cov158-Ochromonas_danica.AAC.13
MKNVRGSIDCPNCKTPLGHIQNYMSKIVFDRNIQSTVDKLFPEFGKQEEKELSYLHQARKRHSEESVQIVENDANAAKKARLSSQQPPIVDRNASFKVTLVPDKNCSPNQLLPALEKPSFHGSLELKVSKIMTFIHKRVMEKVDGQLAKDDIVVYYETHELDPKEDLSSIGPYLSDKAIPSSLELRYRKKVLASS